MALTKKAKIWITILAIPVVIVIGSILTLKLYLTSDRLKALTIPKIEEATHRTVSVEDVSLSVFPTLGVTIDGLKISNPKGLSFDQDEFLVLDRLVLEVKLLPLLSERLEINRIVLEHPKIYLEVTKNGAKNYSFSTTETADALKSDSVKLQIKSTGTSSFLLANFEIRNGEIEYVDKKFDSHLIVAGLNQTATAGAPPGEQAFHFESKGSIEKFSYGSLKLIYLSELPLTVFVRATYHGDKDILTLDTVSASLKDLPLAVTGNISKLKDEPVLDLTVTSPRVQMTHVLSLVPPEMLKATKGLSSSGDVKFTLTVKGLSNETMNPGVNGVFTVTNGTIRYASLPRSITSINLAGSFEKPAAPIGASGIGKFSLDKLSARFGSSDISGKITVTNFDNPLLAATINGSMNLNEVKEFYPLEEGTELAGSLNANVSLEGKVKLPTGIKANGKLEFQNVTIKSATTTRPLRNLNGAITFNNQIIESNQLVMNIGESDLSVSFVMKNYLAMIMEDAAKTGKPSASLTLTSKQLRTADLVSKPLSSQSSASAAKKAGIKNEPQESGLLPGFDIEANVSIGKLITEKFEFNNARGSVSLSNGIITLKNFTVNAFQGTIMTKGTLDVRDPKKRPFNLDLGIVGVESSALLPKFSSFGNNLFGKFTMNTKLQGDLNDTLGLNTQSLLGNGSVQVDNGKLLGFPLMTKLADFTGVNELREVNFKDWTNAFSISNGRLNIKDLKVNAGATNFLMGGSHGLDGSMDYNLMVKLPESVSDQLKLEGIGGQLLQFFKDKEGRINLNFLVSGMTTSPVLKLNTKAQEETAKQALEQKKQQLLDEGKKKVEDELKKKAEEGLKRLFKRP
jgi:uncharacterized protein involved in outer membrane biogenesis